MLEVDRSPSEPISDSILVNVLDMICRSGNDLSPVLSWFNGPNLFTRAIALGETKLLAKACRSVSAFSTVHSILNAVADALEWNASVLSRRPRLWVQQVINYLVDANLMQSASDWLRGVQNGSVHQPMLIHTASWPPAGINAAVESRIELPSELFVIQHNPGRKRSWGIAGNWWLGVIDNSDTDGVLRFGLTTSPDRIAAMQFIDEDRLVVILYNVGHQRRIVRMVINTATSEQWRKDIGKKGQHICLSTDGTLVLYEEGRSWKVWDASTDKTVKVKYPPGGRIWGIDRSAEGIPEIYGNVGNKNGNAVWYWNLQTKSFSMIPLPVNVISPRVWRSRGGHLYGVHESTDDGLILVIDRDGNVKKQEYGGERISAIVFDENAAKVYVVGETSVRSFDLQSDGRVETYSLGSINPRKADVSPLNGEIGLLNDSIVTVITQHGHASGSQTESYWPRSIDDFAFDPSGKFFVIVESSLFHVVNADTGDRIFQCERNVYDTKAVRFVRGTSLMVSTSPSVAIVRDLITGKVINEIVDTKARGRPEVRVHRGRTAVSVRLGSKVHRIVTDEISALYVLDSDVRTGQSNENNNYIARIRNGEFVLSLRATGEEIAWFPLQQQTKLYLNNIFVKYQSVPWSKRPGRNEWVVWDGWCLSKVCIVSSIDDLTQPSP